MRVYWIATNRPGNRSVSKLFLNSLRKLVNKFQPDVIYTVWDERLRAGSNYRRDSEHDYKGQRDRSKDDDIYRHCEGIKALCAACGIRNIFPGVLEADDVICYLVDKLTHHEKVVVSVDQDLLQLVNENTKVYSPIKDKLITESNFCEIVKCPQEHFLHYKALIGDTSDNIQGIAGVGPKRAAKIIEENSFCSLQEEDYQRYCRNLEIVDLRKAFDHHPEEVEIYDAQLKTLSDVSADPELFKEVCAEHELHDIQFHEYKETFFQDGFENKLLDFFGK